MSKDIVIYCYNCNTYVPLNEIKVIIKGKKYIKCPYCKWSILANLKESVIEEHDNNLVKE